MSHEDDLLLYIQKLEKNDFSLCQVLERDTLALKAMSFMLLNDKCEFSKNNIVFLDHKIVSKEFFTYVSLEHSYI